MGRFAERVGWRVPKREREGEEREVERFLEEAGVSRRAFKVWMHNHRNNNNAYCVAGRGQQGSVAAADSSGTDGAETDDRIDLD
ncbi:uncharacterized protein A4U43_C07F36080 [Asparagus officinalis]|uniref:ZF-HD dimerization-type domain-containing protein n=1 Tax=Asparagus officinalis TaxID=4686 RepID=A0A5P1EJI3_ASPOF|nr:uncharacterized protein A4U43_C07F36080 [Asparagus officinalis]